MFVLSMLISSVIICSCQKQDSAAEAQLAQRKTELDSREEALIQREKAVEEKEKDVAEREKALASNRIIQSQRQAPDAAQAEAERQRKIQQLPPEFKALIAAPPDTSRVQVERAQKYQRVQDRAIQTQPGFQGAQKKKTSATAAAPQTAVPETDANSSPSPSPQ